MVVLRSFVGRLSQRLGNHAARAQVVLERRCKQRSAGIRDVDCHLDRKTHPERLVGWLRAVEHDLDRYALYDLDPVAGGIFRRQQREGRTGADADRIDVSLINVAGIDVGFDLDWLADADVGQLGLLIVGGDVEPADRPGTRA